MSLLQNWSHYFKSTWSGVEGESKSDQIRCDLFSFFNINRTVKHSDVSQYLVIFEQLPIVSLSFQYLINLGY